ncbi:MAG: helix-turn-helix transcriptional regulator [Cyanobacteriota bacterium]
MLKTMEQQLTISNLILELRNRLGLSQEKLAAKLGVSFNTVNRWENGHSKPSPMAMKLIEQQVQQMEEGGKDLLEYFSN